ncbi:aconitase iron-sulfur domain-containing protein [Sarocladium strictum]
MAPAMNQEAFNVALLPGDGSGPALAQHVRRVLALISAIRHDLRIDLSEHAFGGAALVAGHSSALPPSTLQACREADAVVVCGCGELTFGLEPEQGLLKLRKELGTFANVRHIRFPSQHLAQFGAYKPEKVQDIDIVFFRELTGGVYYGQRQEANSVGEAYDTTPYSRSTIERLARLAGQYASTSKPARKVYSIDKHNVMATSRLWRSVVQEVFDKEFPTVALEHMLVDTAAMLLSSNPTSLNGVILAENMFGDILSDQAGGMMPSQDINASAAVSSISPSAFKRRPGIFEPFNLKARGEDTNPLGAIQAVAMMLKLSLGLDAEADALKKAIRRTLDPVELIGSDARMPDLGGTATVDTFMDKLLLHLESYLVAANSIDMAARGNAKASPSPSAELTPTHTRPMGVIEKIITQAGVGLTRPCVEAGEMVCVKVDWTVTSELLWGGMEKTYDRMGRPRLYRNDRLWLAVDHTVDPRTNDRPRQRGLITKAEAFQKEANIIDFLPANTSIMHTDFTRDRAQPGRLVVGSDSHTCSAGSMGAFAVGFGAADVVMPMVTGETWFRMPEICRINFIGELPFGVSGKDVILHILGLFKRNTIAFQRAVEYNGPGLEQLSMDARFAIANMTTEFGGMGACFEADSKTAEWISRRASPHDREGGLYFRADPGAVYAEERTIDLSQVKWTVALFPNPDDVVPVEKFEGTDLDGCFIGACTTTEEDLMLAALVLGAGLRLGLKPVSHGKRRVTPGSLTIIKNLKRHGLLAYYEQAGFGIGAPGCSYCVGINDVDVAGEGEVWLSSQNRNFRNRMGKGSFGNITCAAVVAASSFGMKVTDPLFLLNHLDVERWNRLVKGDKASLSVSVEVNEPQPDLSSTETLSSSTRASSETHDTASGSSRIIRSKVQRFGENVDTDAIIPAEFMPGVDNADLGSHCFQYFRPEFRAKAEAGSRIIVAEHGFGSGSSREDAVRALLGSKIEAVIAGGYAFICMFFPSAFHITIQRLELTFRDF